MRSSVNWKEGDAGLGDQALVDPFREPEGRFKTIELERGREWFREDEPEDGIVGVRDGG